MRAASTPFAIRYIMTNLARFSPMLRFCSLVPLPSVYPSIRRGRVGFSLSQPTAPSRTRVSAHRASDRPGPQWTSLRVSCALNPLVGASGNLRALEAGGVGADAEPSGVGGGDAGADHAGVEAEGVGGQPAHPATATTNSTSPSATTVDLRCKRRRCPLGTSPTRAGRGPVALTNGQDFVDRVAFRRAAGAVERCAAGCIEKLTSVGIVRTHI